MLKNEEQQYLVHLQFINLSEEQEVSTRIVWSSRFCRLQDSNVAARGTICNCCKVRYSTTGVQYVLGSATLAIS